MKRISIVGIGMGNPDTLTIKAHKLIYDADCLIGAKRLLETFYDFTGEIISAVRSRDIADAIHSFKDNSSVVVLMSGDVGFFSGAKPLLALLDDQVEIVPGISSLQYFTSRLQTSWDDVHVISMHGRENDIISAVRNHAKTFVLTDQKNNVSSICTSLLEAGLDDLTVSVGTRLSYPDEVIEIHACSFYIGREYDSLAVMIVENPKPYHNDIDVHGLDDSVFQRGDVPMTKSEIRSVSLSKLQLKKSDIVYDIGAGTGSVSVEIGRIVTHGEIYAIEINPNACELIKKNADAFNLTNLHMIAGSAPDILTKLPVPDKAFVGGSKGNMDAIIKVLLNKNPKIRIVMNVIALESLSDALQTIKENDLINVDIVQLSMAKSKEIGSYHMMMGQNPIYIITAEGRGIE